jgi:hypothetical protein
VKPKPARIVAASTSDRRLVDDHFGASYLGISRSQFRALVSGGRIPRVEVPSVDGHSTIRRLLVDRDDLDRLIEVWKRR